MDDTHSLTVSEIDYCIRINYHPLLILTSEGVRELQKHPNGTKLLKAILDAIDTYVADKGIKSMTNTLSSSRDALAFCMEMNKEGSE